MDSPFEFNLNIEDVPEPPERPLVSGEGIIGEVTLKEVANGKVMVTVPLSHPADSLERKVLTLRSFIPAKYFTAGYEKTITDPKEQQDYNMKFAGQFKRMFKFAGITSGPLDVKRLTGKRIGFTTKHNWQDKSQLELGYWHEPKAAKEARIAAEKAARESGINTNVSTDVPAERAPWEE